MAEEIDRVCRIIATINPDKYYDGSGKDLAEFKKIIEKEGFEEAVKKAKAKPLEEHKLVYDSAAEGLEPVYFFILDRMNEFFPGGVEKFVDSFVSSPGSGHFAEFFGYMGKASKYQEEAMKSLGMVNNLIKAIINLIYDLKNFEIRLDTYDKSKSKDPKEAWTGILGLKQLWLDNVDLKRGRGSIHAMTNEMDFATLRDSFMLAESVDKVDSMDLNERIKYIIKPRLQEFLNWKDQSEKELRKRYEMEKTYLRSELESLKLYTRWAKPYLMAAERLHPKEAGRKAELVSVFNSILLNLVLFGKKELKPEKLLVTGEIPKPFKSVKWKRKYYQCILVEFFFRGIPQNIGQGRYAFGGRTEVIFRGYALDDKEIEKLNEKLGETEVGDALKLVEGLTEDSLIQIQDDIKYFLEEKPKEGEEKKEGDKGTNPFFALLGIGKKKEGEKKAKKKEENGSDKYYGDVVKDIAEKESKKTCYTIFDIYKKAHGMPSHPSPY